MAQDLVHRLSTSSSTSQRLIMGQEQPVAERAHRRAGSLTQKSKWNISGISGKLRKWFRRPKLLKEAPNLKQSIRAAFKLNRSWWNILLIFVPFSLFFYFAELNSIALFCFSFLAIIPIPRIYSIAVDEISMRAGSLDRLLDILARNAVELIVTFHASQNCASSIGQSTLVGSIISNLLLTLGLSIFIGGICFSEQTLGMSAAQTYTTLLMLSVASLLLPTLFYRAIKSAATDDANVPTNTNLGPYIIAISHGIPVIQLFVYICLQLFQRFSHQNVWGDNDPSLQKSVEHTPQIRRMLRIMLRERTIAATTFNSTSDPRPPGTDESDSDRVPFLGSSAISEGEQDEKPQMCLSVASVIFIITFAALYWISIALVTSLYDLAKTDNASEFVTLVFLPLLGNVEEIKSAVRASFKDKPGEVLAVTVGASIETALFVFPFTAISSWVRRKSFLILFDTFEAVVLFFSVVIVNYVVQDGKSNWLEGMILMCTYLIFAVTFGFYPGSDPTSEVISCE